MALKKDISLKDNFGVERQFAGAIIRVAEVGGTKTSQTAIVGFLDGETMLTRKTYTFDADLDGPNFIKQAYEHLKTLPEFAGAADV